MLYNSLQFLLFYIIITITYWYLPNKHRYLLLLIGSCYFYMVFVPSYILIIGFTIVIDYIAGICIEKAANKPLRKLLLIISLVSNIGVLVFFKYFNFFNGALDHLLHLSGHHTPFPFVTMLLPIGLSFHTFQAMSYTIEVYRGNHKAEKHFGIYSLYVMFYPQLVAGPIERPQNILWQFHKNHDFDFEKLKSGLMQMAFGLFKKVVIADRLAGIIDKAYADPKSQNGFTFFIISLLYSFQIYCDFSGYTDIGIGAAKTMGIKLVENFNVPYLSRSIGEFWSRWHMSLSTWFRDYLYIPLGGNRVGTARRCFNIMVVFLISGLWHGANWTFMIWGLFHGVLLMIENAKNSIFKKMRLVIRSNPFIRLTQTISIFLLVSFAWIFFRSPDLHTASVVFAEIFSKSFFGKFNFALVSGNMLCFTALLIVVLLVKERFMLVIPTANTRLFFLSISLLLMTCYIFGVFDNKEFIYFQF